jgi:PAS domain S-box-containing protein
MCQRLPSVLSSYLVAVVATAAAVLLRWVVDPFSGGYLLFAPLFGAVAVAVWYGGYRPALVAGAVGILAYDYLFMEPRGRFSIQRVEDYVAVGTYLLTCGIIIGFGQALRVGQRRTAEGHERLRTTLASIGDGVIATDTEGRITMINAVAEQLTGWTSDEAGGRPLSEVFRIVNEQTRRPAENPVERALREGRIIGLANHTVLIARDGSERPIDDTAAPIRCKEGELVGCVLVFRDITDRKRAERALRENEERFRSLVSVIADVPWTTDAQGHFVTPQAAYAAYTGKSWEQLRGDGWAECIHPDDRAELVRIWHNAIASRSTYDTECREWHGPSQAWRWVRARGTPVLNSDGSIREWVGSLSDIDDQKRAEEALRESEAAVRQTAEALQVKEAELQLVINRTPLLLTRSSRDLRYVFVNRASAEFFGRPAAEIIGRPIAEIMGEAAFATIRPHVEAVLQGKSVEFEIEIPYAHPGRRFMRVLYTPDRDERGAVIGWVATLSDISDRKRMEHERDERAAELAEALAKRTEEMRRAETAEALLREADRRKDEFLATLAHELRNPLAPIRNAVQILLVKGPPDPDLKWGREVIDRQVRHMARLLDDLLDVSRITHNKLELRKERVELGAVVQNAVETSRPLIDSDRQELTVALPPEPIHLDADPIRLAQVFSNLLNNAAKYSEPGGHIRLACERQGSDVVVSVRDEGMGIAAEMLPRLFSIFSQARRGLERSQGGLGIGLSLVRGLVELHGGSIEARSEGPGMGSEFIVRLPVVVEKVVPGTTPPSKDAEAGMTKCRLLIVDDLKDSADSLAMLLEMMGHEVHTAYDGEDAIIAAEKFKPEVVLLDIGMTKLDGYDACRRIREQPWGKRMCLVALTGWGQEDDRRRTEEVGFDAHMVKPVDPDELMKLLASMHAGNRHDDDRQVASVAERR